MARNQKKSKGRADTAPFFKLHTHVFTSEEYSELSGAEVKLTIDLATQFNGKNNGDLTTAWTVMKARGWKSKQTLYRAIDGLELKGWIIRTRQGGMHKCNLFALSWLSIDECKGKLDLKPTIVPLNTWKKLTPPVRLSYQVSTETVLKQEERSTAR